MRLRCASDLFPDIDGIPERQRTSYPELRDEVFWSLFDEAAPFSLVPIPGFYDTYQSLHYVARNGIPGDLVECGCFLGGMAIFMARLRERFGLSDKRIVLFDTFEGFPSRYIDPAHDERPVTHDSFLDSVKENFARTLGHMEGVDLVVGPVEETIPLHPVGPLSLLRLDTDYYSSTRVELQHLYPSLSSGGVLIIDDYGVMSGARQATDEYLARLPNPPLLHRINVAVWSGVKP